MDLDESDKSQLTDQYHFNIIKSLPPFSHIGEATDYGIWQDSREIYIKVVEGTLFDPKYVMFFERSEK